MTDDLRSIQADIAFLKNLAQEGRSSPLFGGSILVAAGIVFGAASIAHWLVMTGRIAASPWAYPVIWLGATVIFLGVMFVGKRRAGLAGNMTTANRATGLAWQGVGWSIFALFAAVGIVSWRAQSSIPTLLLPSIVMALYGLAWMVAAALTGKRWIRLTAAASYAASLVLAVFSVSSAVFLIYAAALVLLAVAPGVVLMRQSQKTI